MKPVAAAASAARAQAARNASCLVMTWSAANTATTVSRIARARQLRRDRDGGAGIAPRRLGDDRRLDADLGELLLDQEAVVVIGDDDRRLEHRAVDALRSYPGRSSAVPISAMNCLGMVSRDSGQTRVPAPPHMMTGRIFLAIFTSPSLAASRRASALRAARTA